MENLPSQLDEENLQKIHEMSETIATQLVEDIPPDPLHPKEMQKEKIQLTTEQNIKEFFEFFATGARELMVALLHLRETEPDLFPEQFDAQLEQLGEGLGNMGINPEETKSPRELCGITNETMQVFNRAAADLYVNQEYDKSAAVYSFLTFIEPYEPAYWIGYGNSEYFLKDYGKALNQYESAIELAPNVPDFYFYSAHCYKELGQVNKSIEIMDQVIQVIDKEPSIKHRKEQAELLKQYFTGIANKRL